MKNRKMSLALKIISITLSILILIFVTLTLLVSAQIKNGVFEQQSANMSQAAEQLKVLADQKILNLGLFVESSANSDELVEVFLSGDIEALKTYSQQQAKKQTLVDSIYIVSSGNRYIAGTSIPEEPLLNWEYPGYPSDIEDHHYFVSPKGYFSPLTGNPVVSISSPIMGQDGLEGIFVALINLDALNEELINPQKYGDSGYAYIIDMEGTVVGHGNGLALVSSNVMEYDFTQEMVNSSDKAGRIYYDWTDGSKYAFYSKMEVLPWIIVTSIYDNDLLSLMWTLIWYLVFISIGSIVLMVVVQSISVVLFVSNPLSGISHRISTGAESLESASYQISSSSQELSSFSSELASSVEEISSSIEELQSVVEMNTKNINQSELMMKETNDGAQKVTLQMGELKESLVEINDNSRQIVKIIKVIEDIAFQTNILALNAAVEAARAGDAGRGFAVVADQVKDLAQKSAGAASETALLIEKAIDSVSRGEELGEKVLEVQKDAGSMAQKVATLLDEVNRSSQEQMKGINQITSAINQTNSGVQQSAASAEETAAASEELLSQSEELNSLVDDLSLLVRGKLNQVKDETQSTRRVSGTEKKTAVPSGSSEARMISSPQNKNGKVDMKSAEDIIPFDDDDDNDSYKDF